MIETVRVLTTPNEALAQIKGFRRAYVYHWRGWLSVSEGCDFQAGPICTEVVGEFKEIMRKWWACGRNRSLRCDAELQSTLNAATEPLKRVGSADLRSFQAPSEALTGAINDLWRIFEEGLCLQRRANEVGVSKAILLVTKGRIGPAFDSKVQFHFNTCVIGCTTYIKALGEIANELADFEVRERTTLESLAEQAGRPAAVGRAIDMVLGPREREQHEISTS